MGYFVDILRTRVECRTTGCIFYAPDCTQNNTCVKLKLIIVKKCQKIGKKRLTVLCRCASFFIK